MTRVSITFLLLAACGGETVGDGDATSDGSGASTPTTGPGAETSSGADTGDGPSGACPLEGMFVDCTIGGAEGVAYCDIIDGALQWGPCLPARACELGEMPGACQRCTLEDGVPTVTGSASCECEGEADLPICEQTACVQRWEYGCDACVSFTAGDCFSYGLGCSNPVCDSDLGTPCARVWAQGDGTLTTLEDDAAAVCLLTSLRDGIPGSYDILWGVMFDDGWISQRVHALGDGTVMVEWRFDCPACENFGRIGRSGALELRPAAWFDDCLDAPTTESLIACTIGLIEYDNGQPPEGYAPPFTTGECATLDVACP